MDWKALGQTLASSGLPILANAIVPGSGAIVALVTNALGLKSDATPDQIAAAAGSPDGLLKLKALQDRHEEVLVKAGYEADARQIEAVNKTLQTEAMGGSYWQRNHHAFESSFVCVLIGGIYFILPILRHWWPEIQIPAVPTEAWLMLGGILGVTAWQRGAANVATAKANGN